MPTIHDNKKDILPFSFPEDSGSSGEIQGIDCEHLEDGVNNDNSIETKAQSFEQSSVKEEESTCFQQYEETINDVLNHNNEGILKHLEFIIIDNLIAF